MPVKVLTSCPSRLLTILKSVSILPLVKIFLARTTLVTTPSPGKPLAKTNVLSTKISSMTLTGITSPSCKTFELTGAVVLTFIKVLTGI